MALYPATVKELFQGVRPTRLNLFFLSFGSMLLCTFKQIQCMRHCCRITGFIGLVEPVKLMIRAMFMVSNLWWRQHPFRCARRDQKAAMAAPLVVASATPSQRESRRSMTAATATLALGNSINSRVGFNCYENSYTYTFRSTERLENLNDWLRFGLRSIQKSVVIYLKRVHSWCPCLASQFHHIL
jgi:hypothetical protein